MLLWSFASWLQSGRVRRLRPTGGLVALWGITKLIAQGYGTIAKAFRDLYYSACDLWHAQDYSESNLT